MTLRILAPLLTSACVELVPLDRVPVTGGSAEQRAEVELELEAFDSWVGRGRLTLSEVRFVELPPEIAGQYRHGTQRVHLSLQQPVSELRGTLRHELCHALDHEEGLMDSPDRWFDEQSDALYDWFAMEATTPDEGFPGSASKRRGEVFASFCGQGPFAARLILGGCPEDPASVEVMECLVDAVWTEAPELERVEGLPVPAVEAAVALDGRNFGVDPTRTDGVVHVTAGAGDNKGQYSILLHTGELVPEWAGPLGSDFAPPPPPGLDTFVGSNVSFAGSAAAVVTADLLHLGRSRPRWLVQPEPEAWREVEDCPPDRRATVFVAEDRLWAAWAEDDAPAWRPLP